MNNRRRLVKVLAAGIVIAPLRSFAQQQRQVFRVGFISVSFAKIEDVFFQRLKELGYVEGQNIIVERRYSEEKAELFAQFAAEFVRLNVDLIVVTTTPAVLAAKKATATIPIVQPNSIDPVGAGLIASLARPGGNFNGTTQQAPETSSKRLQLLVESLPRVAVVSVVWNSANSANAAVWRQIQDTARALRIRVRSREVRGPFDFERLFVEMTRERPDALLLIGDRFTLAHGEQVVKFAVRNRIPCMVDRPYLVTAGGLMSYGADEKVQWSRAADLVAKIFKGAKPADLPFEQPTKFEFVINMKTAKALGINIPDSVIVQTTSLIE
jgi:putative ABC transport system substrate-binding protein